MGNFEQPKDFTVDQWDLDVPILCYPFPEVRELLAGVNLSPSFYLGTLTEPKARELLQEGGYSFYDDLQLPTTRQGQIDFEAIHAPILERITNRNSPELLGLSEFEHCYPTGGSTEAMKALMAGWQASGKMTELGVIEGEYPGYNFEANMLGIKTHEASSLSEAGDPVDGRVWFVSNPTAVNGNWHDREELEDFIAQGHEVVLDYAYGGLTPSEHALNVSAPNIRALVTSPSKNFGVYYMRYTGVAYTREEVNPLISNALWFRSLPSLMDTLELYESFEPHELPQKYRDRQLRICEALGRLTGGEMSIMPSDNILMAHSDDTLPDWLHRRVLLKCMAPRGKATFRLSKLFARLEEQELAQVDV